MKEFGDDVKIKILTNFSKPIEYWNLFDESIELWTTYHSLINKNYKNYFKKVLQLKQKSHNLILVGKQNYSECQKIYNLYKNDMVLDMRVLYSDCDILNVISEKDAYKFLDEPNNKNCVDMLSNKTDFTGMKCYNKKILLPTLQIKDCMSDEEKKYIWSKDYVMKNYTVCKWHCTCKYDKLYVKETI